MLGEIFGYVALITAIIGLMPQVIKSYKTHSTDDISMVMLINYFVGSFAWIVHGLSVNDNFVVWSNVLGGTVSVISIIQKLKYDNKYKRA
ncbi:MAG: hypothetical protein J5821_04485 [Alphaproteobacteria bacterium]|nr:hypothetical protein [Alphaproteobacteria bacterium]